MNAGAWGIADGYHDVGGGWHPTPPETVEAFLDAMGAEGDEPPAAAVRVVRRGAQVPVERPSQLDLEDGGSIRVDAELPHDLPLGYHRLISLEDESTVRLIVGPGRCHLPRGLRAWGWAAQLPTVRSAASWGMGDLGDLGELGRWARREHGARTMLLN